MNIIEAYIKFKTQFIILISGFVGSNKTIIAEKLAKHLNFKVYKLEDYFKNKETLNCDYNEIDWELFNNTILDNKKGVICTGMIFDNQKLKFKPDYIIHLQSTKQLWFSKLKEKLDKKNPDKDNSQELENLKKKINNDCYPYFLQNIKGLKANKFMNQQELEFIETNIWDSLMKFTDSELKKLDK